MSEEMTGYGLTDDTPSSGMALNVGLNEKVRMKSYRYTDSAGKEEDLEALEIIFDVGGTDVKVLKFPITRVRDDNGNEVTDPSHPNMIEAKKNFGAIITHVLGRFVKKDVLREKMKRSFKSFKQFIEYTADLLPKNYSEVELDLFLQYQWQVGKSASRTYLEVPRNMKHGVWLRRHKEPVGSWQERIKENYSNNTKDALTYVDDDGNVHPFKRNGWFIGSNFWNQQEDGGGVVDDSYGSAVDDDDDW